MKKIPTAFVRDWEGDPKYVTREPNPECAWVFAGEGVATRKYDGTCVMYDGAQWWARREIKPGKTAPAGFVEIATDEETGKIMGWEPIEQSGFAKHFEQAHDRLRVGSAPALLPGTYELIGPKINGNPEEAAVHTLVLHVNAQRFDAIPLDYDSLASWLHAQAYEGIVWHHPDGRRMAKIKARDFPR